MSRQKEGSLQGRIQKLIKSRGGYCFKNHGDMSTEPGRPDIVCCYQGLFIAIEAKIDENKPSAAQGIHCRSIWQAGGIAVIVWSIAEVEKLLWIIDQHPARIVLKTFIQNELDDGTRW